MDYGLKTIYVNGLKVKKMRSKWRHWCNTFQIKKFNYILYTSTGSPATFTIWTILICEKVRLLNQRGMYKEGRMKCLVFAHRQYEILYNSSTLSNRAKGMYIIQYNNTKTDYQWNLTYCHLLSRLSIVRRVRGFRFVLRQRSTRRLRVLSSAESRWACPPWHRLS